VEPGEQTATLHEEARTPRTHLLFTREEVHVHHGRATECGIGGSMRVTCSAGVGRRRGVRLAVWRACQMRARLVGLSVRQAAYAVGHAGGEDAEKILQNCCQYVSIKN